jgi:hypothetical protein
MKETPPGAVALAEPSPEVIDAALKRIAEEKDD